MIVILKLIMIYNTNKPASSYSFITLVFRVVLSGTYIQSTEYDFEYEFEKSFITTFPTAINLMVLEKNPNIQLGN